MPSPRINLLSDGTAVAGPVLAQLTRAEVRESDSDPSVLALRLSLLQKANGEFSPLDDTVFEPGTTISFEVEPPGGVVQRIFEGVVTHLRPHFETIAANAYLEILGMDAAVLLDAEERVAEWPDTTDSDVVSQIMSTYQITVQAEKTDVQYDEDQQRLTQRATDWRFVQHLAQRNGFRFYFEYDDSAKEVVAHFGPPDVSGPAQPDVGLLQDTQNLTWADLQWTATGPVTVTGAAIDPIAKTLIRADGSPTLDVMGSDDAADAVESGLTGSGATGSVALLDDVIPLDEAIAAQASAATDAARMVIKLRAELDPALYRGILRPRRPVLVRGVGSRMSGTYYVTSVRTTLESGQLTQNFAAVRNATGLAGKEDFGQSAEEVPAT